MIKPNFQRMMRIIDETFATRNDPDQLQVTEHQQEKLAAIHRATLTEVADENGPLIWVLIIPTVTSVMNDFLRKKISEKQILELTQVGQTYDCIYLCSVTTLPEIRGRGRTKEAVLDAVGKIRADHPVRTLFTWPFTKEGDRLAEAIAEETGMKLLKRDDLRDFHPTR
jgi:hypothetical protein